MSRLFIRTGVLSLTGFALLVCAALPAAAHVTVHSDEAVQGGYAQLAFRVPTESDTAATTKVQVAFPTDRLPAFVAVRPHTGWTYQVAKATGYVEWTAAGPESAIKPGEYDEFLLEVGPLPQADALVFKVLQTYDDGRVVRWIDTAPDGAPEPEHPAVTLAIARHIAPVADSTTVVADDATTTWARWSLTGSILALVVSIGAAAVVGFRRAGRAGIED